MEVSELIVICEPFEESAPSRREGSTFCERCAIDVAVTPEVMRAIAASGPNVQWRYLCKICNAHRPPARSVTLVAYS